MTEFALPVRVYLEDTDAGGIVYYVNYLKFMERARTECLRDLGFDFRQLQQQADAQFVVHRVEVRYNRPASMDDHLQVTAKLVKVAKTHVVFEQKVRRGTDTLCEATVKVACVNHTTVKPMAMPSELLARFQMAAILPDNRSE